MRKSVQVFRRDVTRILRARRTWVIVLGVLLTPALYAWFNITAFWDPYANTGNIRVAVVNLDEGATSELTGPIDVGSQVVDQLHDDHQLGWQFMGADEAQAAVRSGEVYAAIVIPKDFSSDLLSITTGTFTQPALTYYVNEKASAIAPKITDVGAAGIDSKISSAFIEQVAEAATAELKDAGDSVELKLLNAKNDGLNAFDEASTSVASARQGIADMKAGIERSRGSLNGAQTTLGDVDRTLGDVRTALGQAQQIVAQAQTDVLSFTDAATNAYVQGATLLADASAQAHVSITQVTQTLGQAGTRIDTAIADITAVAEANAAAIAQLQALLDQGGLDPAVAAQLQQVLTALEQQNQADQQLLADLATLNTDTAGAVQAVQATADALNNAVQGAQASAGTLRDALTGSLPALTSAMATLSTSAGGFSAALDAQRAQLTQAGTLLTGLDAQLVATSAALDSLDGNLAGIQTGLGDARTDVLALGSASSWNTLGTVTGLDPQQIAQFIATPVEVAEHAVFPVDSYGSAMAALFTNLSLWIGAFVMMVIFKVEVDTEGVAPIRVREAYVGRFLLFGTLGVLQAIVVTVGDLIIGVQTANAVAFVGTGILISLAYVSIMYALCVLFGHVGRGLCVLLVIMQIPGASGLYPIELMPQFFRNIYPFLPFTYGIDAMRETIAGFYGGALVALHGRARHLRRARLGARPRAAPAPREPQPPLQPRDRRHRPAHRRRRAGHRARLSPERRHPRALRSQRLPQPSRPALAPLHRALPDAAAGRPAHGPRRHGRAGSHRLARARAERDAALPLDALVPRRHRVPRRARVRQPQLRGGRRARRHGRRRPPPRDARRRHGLLRRSRGDIRRSPAPRRRRPDHSRPHRVGARCRDGGG
ncbi:YhgE/Pip family protein [Microbacterium paulum]